MNVQDRELLQRQIIIDGHNKNVGEWRRAGEAGPGLLFFCQFMIYMDGFMEKYLDLDKLTVPVGGGDRERNMYMKKFILQAIIMHYTGDIDLHSDNPFGL